MSDELGDANASSKLELHMRGLRLSDQTSQEESHRSFTDEERSEQSEVQSPTEGRLVDINMDVEDGDPLNVPVETTNEDIEASQHPPTPERWDPWAEADPCLGHTAISGNQTSQLQSRNDALSVRRLSNARLRSLQPLQGRGRVTKKSHLPRSHAHRRTSTRRGHNRSSTSSLEMSLREADAIWLTDNRTTSPVQEDLSEEHEPGTDGDQEDDSSTMNHQRDIRSSVQTPDSSKESSDAEHPEE
ncbi:hypothetical protein BD324DRAFT_652564 [Kockovaella imperatae]|uniref:Uncharacterized protein n=1 Tax=Kockovaella imperatae TaxID=4999 RepID=A0A1Y1UED4_9TREE|nr:hypothetical protein BD324DRAFT_652564 [Kockovaella imperatae]ORX35435.1 hypothetical protein BD324DRAFT_652564 [Kockovaella imperatae]